MIEVEIDWLFGNITIVKEWLNEISNGMGIAKLNLYPNPNWTFIHYNCWRGKLESSSNMHATNL